VNRLLLYIVVLLLPLTSEAQIRRQVPAPAQESGDFGSKFFDDLRSLFGRLQRSELDGAFQRARAMRCSDLVGQTGEWKEVAFLNDDRSLGDWHFGNIEEVKSDLAAFAFSGTCSGEEGSLRVATSFPVQESAARFQDGKIPFSQIVINENDPVSVVFDRPTGAYTFQLPYVYAERRNGTDLVYTLTPLRTTSKPEPGIAIEFRCKALSDADLTYRFLLCRNRVVNRDPRIQGQGGRPSAGSAAYYILSDGKEASSTVKLRFGDDTDSRSGGAEAASKDSDAEKTPQPPKTAEVSWHAAPSDAGLTVIGDAEFKLKFNAETWKGRIDTPQLLMDGSLSKFAGASVPARSKEYCVWRPGLPAQVHQLLDARNESFNYSLGFRKDLQSAISSIFEIQSDNGITVGTLQCFFPQSQTPADITLARWVSTVGKSVELDVRK
jgi:hypothetical protein